MVLPSSPIHRFCEAMSQERGQGSGWRLICLLICICSSGGWEIWCWWNYSPRWGLWSWREFKQEKVAGTEMTSGGWVERRWLVSGQVSLGTSSPYFLNLPIHPALSKQLYPPGPSGKWLDLKWILYPLHNSKSSTRLSTSQVVWEIEIRIAIK